LLINLNEAAVVPFIAGQLNNVELALSLAQVSHTPNLKPKSQSPKPKAQNPLSQTLKPEP
jgi:hypothetical protein